MDVTRTETGLGIIYLTFNYQDDFSPADFSEVITGITNAYNSINRTNIPLRIKSIEKGSVELIFNGSFEAMAFLLTTLKTINEGKKFAAGLKKRNPQTTPVKGSRRKTMLELQKVVKTINKSEFDSVNIHYENESEKLDVEIHGRDKK